MLKKIVIGLSLVACLATSSFAGSKYFTKDTVNYFYDLNKSECIKISEDLKNTLIEANQNTNFINFKAEKQTPKGGLVFVIETPSKNDDGTYSKLTNVVVSSLESCKELINNK